jgi:large subunit ribosomal protein L1
MTTETPKLKKTRRQQAFDKVLLAFEQPAPLPQGMQALLDAVKPVSKFDESIECHIKLGINMKHADQQVRTSVILPEGTGKTVRVLVLAKGEKVKEAEAAGADFAGSEVLIATPDIMGALGKLGKLLGPRGLMPNPKSGTVTLDVAKAVRDTKAGQVQIRPDKQGIIHVAIGRIRFTPEQLLKNFAALYDATLRARPSAAKGTYVKSVYLSTTMGPSIKLDPSKLSLDVKEFLTA